MVGIFFIVSLLIVAIATVWLIASLFFRKNKLPLSERIKKWGQLLHDAFWGMG